MAIAIKQPTEYAVKYNVHNEMFLSDIILVQHPLLLVVSLWPDPTLPRCQNASRIKSILYGLIQSHQGMVIEVIRHGHLVHQADVCPELTPTVVSAVLDHSTHKPLHTPTHVWVFAVKDYTNHIVCVAGSAGGGNWWPDLHLRISRIPMLRIPM